MVRAQGLRAAPLSGSCHQTGKVSKQNVYCGKGHHLASGGGVQKISQKELEYKKVYVRSSEVRRVVSCWCMRKDSRGALPRLLGKMQPGVFANSTARDKTQPGKKEKYVNK